MICLKIQGDKNNKFSAAHTYLNTTTACSKHISGISIFSWQSLSIPTFTLTYSYSNKYIFQGYIWFVNMPK